VVLLEVDLHGVARVPFECHAPWAVDMDGVARRSETLEPVEAEAWHIEVFQPQRFVEDVEAYQNALGFSCPIGKSSKTSKCAF